MKIIDCFTFYNELEMLFFRLTELYDVVDYFVIVEAAHTHSGKEKGLFFSENKNKYSKFLDKIIHVVVSDMPNTDNSWDNENYQRNCIDRGIKVLKLSDEDLIIISDCDEIPDVNTLSTIKNNNIILDDSHSLQMDMYYYNMMCRGDKWYRAKIIPYNKYKNINLPEEIRMKYPSPKILLQGGWHFSYFGGIEFIKNKIQNFSHQEFNNETYLDDEKIKKQIENCDDLFFRENENFHNFKKISIDENTYLPINYKLLLQNDN